MKKKDDPEETEMRKEYDFSKGVRGKHHRQYKDGHAVHIRGKDGTVSIHYFTQEEGAVMLDPDVRARFPDSQAVNRALRTIIQREDHA